MILKLPNYKEINWNIKNILNDEYITNFQYFKQKHNKGYSTRLWAWIYKNYKGVATSELQQIFKEIWTIQFYYGFVNWHQEQRLIEYLEAEGFIDVKRTGLINDTFNKIDVVGYKHNFKFCFQVKPYNKGIYKLSYKLNPEIILALHKPDKRGIRWRFFNWELKEVYL